MKHTITVLFLLLFAAALPAQNDAQPAARGSLDRAPMLDVQKQLAAQPEAMRVSSPKLDVQLQALLHRQARQSLDGAGAAPASLLESCPRIAARVEGGVVKVQALIQASDVRAAEALVTALGGIVYTHAGDVITTLLPLSSVAAIAESDAILRIEAATIMDATMNVSRSEIRADMVQAGTGLPQAYTGSGIVVGILDTGIDPAHVDFRTANGSRIQYLWDMSDSTSTIVNPPSDFGYGREYLKARIDAGLCLEQDENGHGTHVAGTSAGNGSGAAAFTGIAPDADLVIVKGTRYGAGFSSVDVINGCDYIFKRAATLGKPAVINLSIGGQSGPHDASGLEERGIDALTGPGRIIVAAAGNDGDRALHLCYQTGGDIDEPRVSFFKVDANTGMAIIDVWCPSSVRVGLAAYNSYPWLISYTSGVMHGESLGPLTFIDDGTPFAIGWIQYSSSPAANGLYEAYIIIQAVSGAIDISDYTFALYTYGSGLVNAWMVSRGEFAPNYDAAYHIYPGDRLRTVSMPGTASTVVTVGSYVTKTQWVDITGTTQYQPNTCGGSAAPVVGQLSCFSGIGPTRDGRPKPDITAPGEMIFAAYSTASTCGDERMLAGGLYRGMEGTSMATPHVTGTVALMLQRNGRLSGADVKTNFASTARAAGSTPSGIAQNLVWGSGKVDAYAAVLAVTPGKEGRGPVPASASIRITPNPVAGMASIAYELPDAGAVTLRIRDVLGREVAMPLSAAQDAGAHDVAFDARSLPGGVYFCTVESAGQSACARMIVAGK